ncbi:MAG: YtxH domain-containing protein [Flavobacteriales bacterium]|nr:YtxH domain-containing protein [Flavobacteriales bacterium]
MANETKNGILGFLAGAAVGAALGVLFAPRSGKETREQIAKRVSQGKDDLDDVIEQARAEWNKTKGKAADAAAMTKDEENDFVRFLFEEGKDLKGRLKNDVKDVANDVADKARKTAEHVRNSAN